MSQPATSSQKVDPKPFTPFSSYPSSFSQQVYQIQEREILENFHKVEINIPLLDAIKQVLRYEKFLKELCTSKRKLKGNKKVSVGENVSAVL